MSLDKLERIAVLTFGILLILAAVSVWLFIALVLNRGLSPFSTYPQGRISNEAWYNKP